MNIRIADKLYEITLQSKILYVYCPETNEFHYKPITIQFKEDITVDVLYGINTIEIISYRLNTNAIIVFDGYDIENNYVRLNPIRYCSIITN